MRPFLLRIVVFCTLFAVNLSDNSNYCQAPVATREAHIAADAMLPAGNNTIRAVQVVTRHGDRTQINMLPYEQDVTWECDANYLVAPSGPSIPPPIATFRRQFEEGRNALPGNCGLQELTSIGQKQHFALGKSLHDLYAVFYHTVADGPPSDDVFVRSTNTYRTQASAQSFMTGFFGNYLDALADEIANGNGNIDADTIPVAMPLNIADVLNTTICPNTNNCPVLAALYQNMTKTDEWKKHETIASPMKTEIAALFGLTVFDVPDDLGKWMDPIMVRYCHGKPEPKGLTEQNRIDIYTNATWEAFYKASEKLTQRLASGRLFTDITDSFTQISLGNDADLPHFVMNSGHDSSVVGLQTLLGIGDGYWPPYCSHMEFELIQHNESTFFIRVWYNDEVMDLPCSDSTGIKGLCTIEGFKETYAYYMITIDEYQKICDHPPIDAARKPRPLGFFGV